MNLQISKNILKCFKNLRPIIIQAILLSVSTSIFAISNDTISNQDSIKIKIVNGDTVFTANLPAVTIYPPKEFANTKEFQKYLRLIRNVKKAYPYAVLASEKLKEVDAALSKLETKKDKKAYLDSTEKKLRDQFEEQLKELTITQGRILIKLIYRETGNTTYYHVKELRGSFSAFFWQTVARLFGSNLKSKYDPLGEDKDIEEIIIKIQKGQL